jgi:hypothetical protein
MVVVTYCISLLYFKLSNKQISLLHTQLALTALSAGIIYVILEILFSKDEHFTNLPMHYYKNNQSASI